MFHILVVEDDSELNSSVCSFLNQSGYEATGCLNAANAYDAMYEKVIVLAMSVIMIVHSTKQIKKLQTDKS